LGENDSMRYLCLIHLDERELAAMPAADVNAVNAAHLDLNDALRASGHFLVAEALERSGNATCVRVRNGQPIVTDGPFAETKEAIAGFYLIEARDLQEATELAARLPSARFGTVEIRPARQLVVEGRAPRWG
jgi:hypothetical protein